MRLKSVRSELSNMVSCNQFNTARAEEAFAAAIHWAVWDYVKDHPHGRNLYRDFKRSRLAPGMAEELAAGSNTKSVRKISGGHEGLRFLRGP
jgi:hypothetical protein